MNNEPVAWKAYEEVHFNDQYILRWVREGAEYVNRITCDMMEDLKSVVRQQQTEIEALKSHPAELTDEEILDLCPPNHSDMMNEAYTIEFARAILRKAQEK